MCKRSTAHEGAQATCKEPCPSGRSYRVAATRARRGRCLPGAARAWHASSCGACTAAGNATPGPLGRPGLLRLASAPARCAPVAGVRLCALCAPRQTQARQQPNISLQDSIWCMLCFSLQWCRQRFSFEVEQSHKFREGNGGTCCSASNTSTQNEVNKMLTPSTGLWCMQLLWRIRGHVSPVWQQTCNCT